MPEVNGSGGSVTTLIKPEALLFAIVPVIAYGLVVVYELGYAHATGFDVGLVSLTFAYAFEVAVWLVMIAIIHWGIVAIVVGFASRMKSWWWRMLFEAVIGFLLIAHMFVFVALTGYIEVAFLFAIGGMLGVLAAMVDSELPKLGDSVRTSSIFAKIFEFWFIPHHSLNRILGRYASASVFMLIVLGLLIYAASHIEVHLTKRYMVLEDNQDVIVLRIYKDHMVGAEIDRKTCEATGLFYVMPLSDPTTYRMKEEEIGVVRFKPRDAYRPIYRTFFQN